MRSSRVRAILPLVLVALFVAADVTAQSSAPPAVRRSPDVPFVPTPQDVVDEMLRLARIQPNDVLYDLGSGDGRIVITAAQRYGVRGLGIDIDPDRVREAREAARKAGVHERVRFIEGDIFTADLREATVVTMYLLPSVNMKLRPKLLAELRPGTRIVSHSFDLGDWKPEETVRMHSGGTERVIYFWTVPPRGARQ